MTIAERNDILHNDIQYNAARYNDTQLDINTEHNYVQDNIQP